MTIPSLAVRHLDSWYAATVAPHSHHPPLRGDIRADITVIGAGFTGLSAALHLAESGYKVVVLEAKRIGWGASGRNGGQVGTGMRKPMSAIDLCYGSTIADALWAISESGKAIIQARIKQHHIDCHWQSGNLLACTKPRYLPAISTEAEFCAKRYGYDNYRLLDASEIRHWIHSDQYCGGLYDSGGGHLHPLNLVLGIGQAGEQAGVRIYEQSPVIGIDWEQMPRIRCDSGNVRSDFVLLCMNGYLDGLEPRIAATAMPIQSHIAATAPMDDAMAAELIPSRSCVHSTKFVVDYYRLSHDNRLLFGGGESYSNRELSNPKAFVRSQMLGVFPQLAKTPIDYAWGGMLAITSSRLPHVGYLGPNVLFAQGYSGHGVALSHAVGKLMADAIAGTAERFDVLAALRNHRFPGGTRLRQPLLTLGMLYYALCDKL